MIKVLNAVSTIGALVMAATPLMAISSVARAQDMAPEHIRIADLDLSRPADQARFQARVDLAAVRMCGSVGLLNVEVACRQAVREEAMQKLDQQRADAAIQTAQAADRLTVAGR